MSDELPTVCPEDDYPGSPGRVGKRCACGYAFTDFDGTQSHAKGCKNDPWAGYEVVDGKLQRRS